MSEAGQVSLTGRVMLARRARLHVRLGESLILGVAAALLLLCLALLSGSNGLELDAWMVAGTGAVMVGALWMFETRQGEYEWACRVDRSLGLNGRLLAALNVERTGDGGSMGQLLIEGLRPRVTRKTLLHRAVPVSLWLFVLPFVGGSLLLQGLHSQRNQVIRWDRSAPQFRALQDRLGEAQQRAQALGEDPNLKARVQAMRETARLGGVEMELGQGNSEAWSSKLEELAKDLATTSQELQGDAQWDRAMDQAQSLVASLLDRAGESGGTGPAPNGGKADRASTGSQGVARDSASQPNGRGNPESGVGGSRNPGGQGSGNPGGNRAANGVEDPERGRPMGVPDWGSENWALAPIPNVPRPYRSLVRKFRAAGQ